jgi:transposase-like protein
MECIPRQKLTKDFREQALRLVLEQKLTISEAVRRLAMADKTLATWMFQARHG